MTEYTRQTGSPTQLAVIAETIGATVAGHAGDATVESVTADSRKVRPGDLFVATPGEKVHGAAFAASAIEAGASAVLTDEEGRKMLAEAVHELPVPILVVDEPRAVMGAVAAMILGEPAAGLGSYAITGTNGKTTTAYMVESVLRALGRKPGLIGTVEIRLADMSVPAHLTTPMPDELQSYLAFHRRGGGTDIVMETSSHALVQGRSDPLAFTVAGFTNLTQDHLDFHGTMERYYEAKASLFTEERARNAVVTVDDEWGRRLLGECAPRLRGAVAALAVRTELPELPDGVVGWKANADDNGSSFVLESTDGRRLATSTSLPGDFNVANAALAAVMVMTSGYAPADLERALPEGINLAVPGRMEVLNARPRVIVDFAHNTEALVNAMKALRASTDGRLIVLTGSAGDRDKGKRPAMGAAVARYGDLVYITDDDPHDEDPSVIRAAVIEGTKEFDTPVIEIADRSQAIDAAIADASERDTILLAGRGHETVQEVAGVPIELDDRVEARRALRKRACVRDGEEKA
jgi:UDP-N-acetylmuramyl-tripeptide synthetase